MSSAKWYSGSFLMVVPVIVYSTGSGSGDPHYITFDRRPYTFNGNGDFTVLEVLPEDSDVPVFTLQGRLGRTSFFRRTATTHLGLAFGQPNVAFHVGIVEGASEVFVT